MNIIIWGYCYKGAVLFELIRKDNNFRFIGFADNSEEKANCFVNGQKILNINECRNLMSTEDFSVIIATEKWCEVGQQLEELNIPIYGYFDGKEINKYSQLRFCDIENRDIIKLYAGDIYDDKNLNDDWLIGLSITKSDKKHIYHDITKAYSLPDNSVSSYVAEHVLEHLDINMVPIAINEIYRILKKGAKLRICLPDYNSDQLRNISMRDDTGGIVYDALGGGTFINGIIGAGGHLWFPTYTIVNSIIEKTDFTTVNFVRYRKDDGELVELPFDNSCEYLYRMDEESFDANMVIDCIK